VLDVRSGAVTACIASGADASTPVTCEPVSPAKADRAVVIAPHS
jgi:hypothetical protein